MASRRAGSAALLTAAALVACAGRSADPSPPPPGELESGWSQTGVASWYGEPFHGRTTASGEVYDMDRMTAAHRWLPFGTVVRVENRDNGRQARLRINDRGPFVDDRIIDVSRAGARELGMIGPGTANVRVVLEETPAQPDCFELQVGAYGQAANAQAARARIEDAGYENREERADDGLRRVLAGPFPDLEAAEDAKRRLGGIVRACERA